MNQPNPSFMQTNNGFPYYQPINYPPYIFPQSPMFYTPQPIPTYNYFQPYPPQPGSVYIHPYPYPPNNSYNFQPIPHQNIDPTPQLNKPSIENLLVDNIVPGMSQPQVKEYICNCFKSNCMKEYCLCFKNSVACGQKCGCVGCRNKQNSKIVRPLKGSEELVSCSCKKSKCTKKYCDCFSSGKKCSQKCECIDCGNYS